MNNSGLPTGHPFTFQHGPLSGQRLRAELTELQQPVMARKSGARDRRVIDPPPVLQLRFYRPAEDGMGESAPDVFHEVESYSDLRCEGILCQADLFPAPETCLNAAAETSPADVTLSSAKSTNRKLVEGDKCQEHLAGSMFVQAVNIPHGEGHAIMFAFADLSVKLEGAYVLRYRCFDLLSQAIGISAGAQPALAECIGSEFRVYPTKGCPRLAESTELSKTLFRLGVKMNVREGEKRGRGPELSSDAKTSGSGKRKAREMADTEGDEDDEDDEPE